MKNKKTIIIVLIILIICAVCFAIFKVTHNPNYLYDEEGTIVDGHKDLLNHLKEIEDSEERKKQIDFSVEQNLITQEEANNIY